MIILKNKQTGSDFPVYNVVLKDGYRVISYESEKEKGSRFINKWSGVLTEHRDENGKQYFTISSEYDIVKAYTHTDAEGAEAKAQQKDAATATPNKTTDAPKAEPKAKDTTPKATPTPTKAKEDAPKAKTPKA